MKLNLGQVFLLLLLAFTPSAYLHAAGDDGILHAFYNLNVETDGRRVGSVNTSHNVVLGTPLKETFEGRCQVLLQFESSQSDEYLLALTVREMAKDNENIIGLPVDHFFRIHLDEQLQFSIQTDNGLSLSGLITLSKVGRFEVAD